ncbi:MAG: aldehyde dehydrogenase family protein, partial [Planctomycetota bacterium]
MSATPFQNEPFTDFGKPENQQAFQKALEKIQGTFGNSWPAWIGGEQIQDRPMYESRDPGDLDRVIGVFPRCDETDGDRAVNAAHEAFQTWRYYFFEAAKRLRQRRHEFSAMMVYEAGKSWAEADADTAEAIDFMDYYARQAIALAKPPDLTRIDGEQNTMVYIPLGVGVIIPPWNFPLAIMCGMSSAALVTGNTICLKPATTTP